MTTATLRTGDESAVDTKTVWIDQLQAALSPLINTKTGLFVQLIGDYKTGDQASAKMGTAIAAKCPPNCLPLSFLPSVSVPPLDTVRGGFETAMLACGPLHLRPRNTLFYLNVAPIAKRDSRNGGHEFYAALLEDGTVVFSPSAGHSFSAIASRLRAVFVLACEQENVQFRSWALFPEIIGKLLEGDFSVVERVIEPNEFEFEAIPASFAVDFDNFGNIRSAQTTESLVHLGLSPGEPVVLLRDGVPIARGVFGNAPDGTHYPDTWLSVKPGSNIVGEAESSVTYLDIFRTAGSARRICVLDIEDFRISIGGAFSEACAVASRVRREFGILKAARGFFSVFRLRFSEWRRDVGDYERHIPVLTVARSS